MSDQLDPICKVAGKYDLQQIVSELPVKEIGRMDFQQRHSKSPIPHPELPILLNGNPVCSVKGIIFVVYEQMRELGTFMFVKATDGRTHITTTRDYDPASKGYLIYDECSQVLKLPLLPDQVASLYHISRPINGKNNGTG